MSLVSATLFTERERVRVEYLYRLGGNLGDGVNSNNESYLLFFHFHAILHTVVMPQKQGLKSFYARITSPQADLPGLKKPSVRNLPLVKQN